MRTYLLSLLLLTSLSTPAQGLIGDWTGTLEVTPQTRLKLVFHIGNNSINMDSPDQGATGIEGEIVFLSADSVNFNVSRLMMNYAGKLKGNKLDGTFSQGGIKLPLSLTSGHQKANRPQAPTPPFPYSTEEVKITAPDAVLAGTLTLPEGYNKKTPIVVMVTGSGLQNRDEELFEHKPFAVIADRLARNGIASLRYDDRGFGQSTGNATNATTADFAEDASAVVDWLRNEKSFVKAGMLGHSEGGLISYILGAEKDKLDFIISIAGPAVRGDSILVYQNLNALHKSGVPDEIAAPFGEALSKAFNLKIDFPMAFMTDEMLLQIYPQLNDSPLTRRLGEGIWSIFKPGAQSKWMQYFIAYSPADALKSLTIPAFLIYGEKDTQVPPELNVPQASRLAPKAKIKVYPYLNHLMQHAETGNVEEYRSIEETISEEVLTDIIKFIKEVK